MGLPVRPHAVEIEVGVDGVERLVLARVAFAVFLDVVVNIGVAPGIELARHADVGQRIGQRAVVNPIVLDGRRDGHHVLLRLRIFNLEPVAAVNRQGDGGEHAHQGDGHHQLQQGEAARALAGCAGGDGQIHARFVAPPRSPQQGPCFSEWLVL